MQVVSTAANVKIERRPQKSLVRQSLLSLYHEPPQHEITLDEFELLSLNRLELLRSIEKLRTRNLDDRQFQDKIYQLEGECFFGKNEITNRLSATERDRISHFILRLAFCQTEDLRRWFLTQECALLKARLDIMGEHERQAFMLRNGLEYEQVTTEEKLERTHKLVGVAGVNHINIVTTNFYKVPFQQALTLVSTRKVYLERGYAYVPLNHLMSIIIYRFRTSTSRALTEAVGMFDQIICDTRIGPLLKNLNKQFIGNDFTKNTQNLDTLTADMVESAADLNMPLCMKHLHSNLKREHKLKHWGRLQYGLFLKGAGLDLDGAVAFWESHFTKIMNHDQFVKSYGYSFRHMYGKEGARKNYTPYSCMKIIMGTPPETGAYHGCPYRHLGDNQLVALLNSLKLSAPDVNEIKTLAKTSNYQLACQKHFDVTHPGHQALDPKLGEAVANHPNEWFRQSVAYFKLKNGKAKQPVAAQGTASGAAQMDVSQSQTQTQDIVTTDEATTTTTTTTVTTSA